VLNYNGGRKWGLLWRAFSLFERYPHYYYHHHYHHQKAHDEAKNGRGGGKNLFFRPTSARGALVFLSVFFSRAPVITRTPIKRGNELMKLIVTIKIQLGKGDIRLIEILLFLWEIYKTIHG